MQRVSRLVAVLLLALASPARTQAPSLPVCGVVTRASPYLASYDQLSTPGAGFRIRLRYDAASRSWTPSPALRMPLHHASSIDYGGFAMPEASAQGVELEVVAVARRLVRFEAAERTWFFEYRVRVVSACRAGA